LGGGVQKIKHTGFDICCDVLQSRRSLSVVHHAFKQLTSSHTQTQTHTDL